MQMKEKKSLKINEMGFFSKYKDVRESVDLKLAFVGTARTLCPQCARCHMANTLLERASSSFIQMAHFLNWVSNQNELARLFHDSQSPGTPVRWWLCGNGIDHLCPFLNQLQPRDPIAVRPLLDRTHANAAISITAISAALLRFA